MTPKSNACCPYVFVSKNPLFARCSNASIGSTIPVSLPVVVPSVIPGGSSPLLSAIKYSIVSPAGKSGSISCNWKSTKLLSKI